MFTLHSYENIYLYVGTSFISVTQGMGALQWINLIQFTGSPTDMLGNKISAQHVGIYHSDWGTRQLYIPSSTTNYRRNKIWSW